MPRFVTIEGIDGTGKTSVCNRVHKALVDEGLKVRLTREPSDSWLGKLVKASFERDISPFSEALLFCADRAQHTREIEAWLASGSHVLCDRYVDSTIAYQGAVLGQVYKGDDLLHWLMTVNRPFIRVPDLSILLVADPEVCLDRIGARTDMTKFEKLDTLRAVDANYKRIMKGEDRFVQVDAARPLEDVVAETLAFVRRTLEG